VTSALYIFLEIFRIASPATSAGKRKSDVYFALINGSREMPVALPVCANTGSRDAGGGVVDSINNGRYFVVISECSKPGH
jgi:hypothetical protein